VQICKIQSRQENRGSFISFYFSKKPGTAKTTGDPVGMSACPPYQVQKAGEIYLNRSRRRNFGFNLYYSALIDDHSPIS